MIDGVNDPTLTLCRGRTYNFEVNAPGHPFLIKTVQGSGLANQFAGASNNGTQSGTITLSLDGSAPATLFYNCQFHLGMTGTINVVD